MATKTEELKELKKNECGKGILIENDGYILTDKNILKESLENGEEWFVPNPFIVKAVFQKYDIKNANGRVYPENVLKREVERYQQRIKERRALGECYTPDAKVLTAYNGWKSIEDIKEGEEIFTLNTSTKEIEIKPIYRKIEKDYEGEIIHLFDKDNLLMSDNVTPNHNYPVFDENDEFKGTYSADYISAHVKSKFFKNCYIPYTLALSEYNQDKEIKDFSLRKILIENLLPNRKKYNGKVYCLEVDNHTFYVNQGDHSHWSNNCNHPDSSSIDLSRVSHNITELHWENKTLVGEMEIFTSYGFRKQGIVTTCGDIVANLLMSGYKIGVSSRAIGSVEEKLGVLIVGDDLEIIAWDVVADPSTPNAYIFNDEQEKVAYVESKEEDKTKLNLNEKLNKIKNILK